MQSSLTVTLPLLAAVVPTEPISIPLKVQAVKYILPRQQSWLRMPFAVLEALLKVQPSAVRVLSVEACISLFEELTTVAPSKLKVALVKVRL